jgi:hypothetical protein
LKSKKGEMKMPTALQVVQKFFPEVKEVVDAERNAIIEVTKQDEKTANKKSHKTCAMAVACKRKFNLDGVVISVNRAYLVKGKKARRFMLPESVSREVVSFDRDGGFEPGEYELQKVPRSSRLDRVIKGNGHGGGSPNSPRRHVHKTGGIRTSLGSKMAAE